MFLLIHTGIEVSHINKTGHWNSDIYGRQFNTGRRQGDGINITLIGTKPLHLSVKIHSAVLWREKHVLVLTLILGMAWFEDDRNEKHNQEPQWHGVMRGTIKSSNIFTVWLVFAASENKNTTEIRPVAVKRLLNGCLF